MLILAGIAARLRDRSGFTLVETLVAMVTGIIVTGALFMILEISVRQSSRLSNVAQATQVSRVAMTHVVDELRSACLSSGFSPVIGGEAEKGSTANKLMFVNGYDEKLSKAEEPPAELPAAGIHKDVIEYNEKTEQLVDKTYVASTNTPVETAEKYTFAVTPSSTVTLATNVKRIEEGGETKPIFQYLAYNTASSSGTSSAASTINEKTPLTAPLTEASAKQAASVVVRFRTAPYSKEVRLNATPEKGTFADQTSQTIFALSAPNSETTITAAPCE
jgi:type II secretory pathway pseudopilin PulG